MYILRGQSPRVQIDALFRLCIRDRDWLNHGMTVSRWMCQEVNPWPLMNVSIFGSALRRVKSYHLWHCNRTAYFAWSHPLASEWNLQGQPSTDFSNKWVFEVRQSLLSVSAFPAVVGQQWIKFYGHLSALLLFQLATLLQVLTMF